MSPGWKSSNLERSLDARNPEVYMGNGEWQPPAPSH